MLCRYLPAWFPHPDQMVQEWKGSPNKAALSGSVPFNIEHYFYLKFSVITLADQYNVHGKINRLLE